MCGRFRGGPRPYSFALPRTTFDTILVVAAARAGAEVRECVTVENLVFDHGTVAAVVGRSGDPKGLPDGRGKRETYGSRVVVAAGHRAGRGGAARGRRGGLLRPVHGPGDLCCAPGGGAGRRMPHPHPHPLSPSPFRRGGTFRVPPLPEGEGDRG